MSRSWKMAAEYTADHQNGVVTWQQSSFSIVVLTANDARRPSR